MITQRWHSQLLRAGLYKVKGADRPPRDVKVQSADDRQSIAEALARRPDDIGRTKGLILRQIRDDCTISPPVMSCAQGPFRRRRSKHLMPPHLAVYFYVVVFDILCLRRNSVIFAPAAYACRITTPCS